MTRRQREELKDAIDQAKRAWLEAQGDFPVVEAAAQVAEWEAAGHSRRRIASWLKRRNLSHRQIAAAMGISSASVCRLVTPSYRQKSADWFREHREQHAARVADYYQRNRDAVNARRRARYAEMRTQIQKPSTVAP